jgi:hypothetical protein
MSDSNCRVDECLSAASGQLVLLDLSDVVFNSITAQRQLLALCGGDD